MKRLPSAGDMLVPYYRATGSGTKALPGHIPEDFSDYEVYSDLLPEVYSPPIEPTQPVIPEVEGELLQSVTPRIPKAASAIGWGLAGMAATARFGIERGSNTTPNAGLLGIRFPYITVVRPKADYPTLYNEHVGRPTNISDVLGNFHGYTVVAEIHLDNVSATLPEKREIENLLKGGVIL